jgi:hypothetical protein
VVDLLLTTNSSRQKIGRILLSPEAGPAGPTCYGELTDRPHLGVAITLGSVGARSVLWNPATNIGAPEDLVGHGEHKEGCMDDGLGLVGVEYKQID